MPYKSFSMLFLAIFLMVSVRAQVLTDCSVRIIVEDTILLTDDTVQYHLVSSSTADSLHWYPDSLFANPTASSQWVTLGCGDTLPVKLTAFYTNANLFHWKQPDFVRTHTEYNYFQSPSDGDFCEPRSITYDSYPQNYCAEMDYNTPQRCIIIRPDTLRCYDDTIQPFFPIDYANPASHINSIMPSLRQVPLDSAYVPFYVDTVDLLNPDPNHVYVLQAYHFTASQIADSLYSVPMLLITVNCLDDTALRFFGVNNYARLCDTTLFYFTNYTLPIPAGNGAEHFINSTWHFNMRPAPHGRAVFRFYETPTPYYYTTGSYCFSRIEMPGYCTPSDSLLLTGPQCQCIVRDTVIRGVCQSQFPYHWDSLTFQQPGIDSMLIRSFYCDTMRCCVLQIIPDDTLSWHDTIVENQLPWLFRGNTYSEPTTDTLLLPGTLPACDTLLYYQLTVINNVYDTTLTYICPKQLPYTLAGVVVNGDTLVTQHLIGSLGQDSIVTHILHVNADSDTSLYDTIVSSQLPWGFLDSLFTDSVSNMPFILTNEVGCDSIIYYNLYIFWEGDHCDSMLTFYNVVTPNGDGINDRFVIGGLVENQCYPYNSLIIVDRTGRIVYRGENIYREEQFWDPVATRSPAGTYFYRFVGRGIHHATQHNGCIEVLK